MKRRSWKLRGPHTLTRETNGRKYFVAFVSRGLSKEKEIAPIQKKKKKKKKKKKTLFLMVHCVQENQTGKSQKLSPS